MDTLNPYSLVIQFDKGATTSETATDNPPTQA